MFCILWGPLFTSFYVRKPRLTELSNLPRGLTARGWKSWDSNLDASRGKATIKKQAPSSRHAHKETPREVMWLARNDPFCKGKTLNPGPLCSFPPGYLSVWYLASLSLLNTSVCQSWCWYLMHFIPSLLKIEFRMCSKKMARGWSPKCFWLIVISWAWL